MTTEPSGVTTHRVNDTLLMRCDGIVGTVLDDSQLEWIWQYQVGNRFPGLENWQPYRDIGDNSADIQTDSSITTTNSCYNRQVSVLTRHLTLSDTDREYRCYVINNDVSGSQNAQANAQVISVGTVSESGVAPTTPGISSGSVTTTTVSTGTDKSKDDRLKTCDCPDVGVIIGAVVAVLIVIDVVILAVVIIVLKRRMTHTKSRETRVNDNQMSSFGNVSRPVEQRPGEQRPVEQRPVEPRPVEQRPVE
ncbi:uncharacterized protein [Littorina saxatilis]|uniref:uncharacterized protein n=1 Tax=Littorina saxatilis TaxID=31220 RepID=UPI0038B5CC8E